MSTGVKKTLILLAIMAIVAFGGTSLIETLLGASLGIIAGFGVFLFLLVIGLILGTIIAERLVKD